VRGDEKVVCVWAAWRTFYLFLA